MSRIFDFNEQLQFSQGRRQQTDVATIATLLPGCTDIIEADQAEQRLGIDYKAQLLGGAIVYIDAKARAAGCSAYWTDGPELALELWSLCPDERQAGKIGWTLDTAKQTDLILFTFDACDCLDAYLLGFQHLRMALDRNVDTWPHRWRTARQRNDGYWSECVFVPALVVMRAIGDVSRGRAAVA